MDDGPDVYIEAIEKAEAERDEAWRLLNEVLGAPGVEDCLHEHDRDIGDDLHARAIEAAKAKREVKQ